MPRRPLPCAPPFKHAEKPPNIFHSCVMNNAIFSQYVWPFFSIMHETIRPFPANAVFPLISTGTQIGAAPLGIDIEISASL